MPFPSSGKVQAWSVAALSYSGGLGALAQSFGKNSTPWNAEVTCFGFVGKLPWPCQIRSAASMRPLETDTRTRLFHRAKGDELGRRDFITHVSERCLDKRRKNFPNHRAARVNSYMWTLAQSVKGHPRVSATTYFTPFWPLYNCKYVSSPASIGKRHIVTQKIQ